MGIFTELNFNVNEKVFFKIFKAPDEGFGFTAKIPTEELTELQLETFKYLATCQEKRLFGSVQMIFNTDGVGEITKLKRQVEKIELKDKCYIISNTY